MCGRGGGEGESPAPRSAPLQCTRASTLDSGPIVFPSRYEIIANQVPIAKKKLLHRKKKAHLSQFIYVRDDVDAGQVSIATQQRGAVSKEKKRREKNQRENPGDQRVTFSLIGRKFNRSQCRQIEHFITGDRPALTP